MGMLVSPYQFLSAAPNPTFSNVRLLSGFNGTDASTTITMDVGGTATAVGNAQLDTAQKKFGTASLLLDGTGDFVTLADSGSWDLGVNDEFQIENFIRWPSGASFAVSQTFLSQWDTPGLRAYRFALDSDGLLKLQYSTDGTATSTAVSVAWTPSTEVQYHIAYSRVAGVSRLFVDGIKLAQSGVSNFDPVGSSSLLRIGANAAAGAGTNFVNGWIDEMRFTKIIGGGSSGQLYTTDFVPPAAEFPRS